MSDILETEAEPLTIDKLDKYCQVAASIVSELQDFLSAHYVDLTLTKHEPNKWGESMTMSQASQDPKYAGEIHHLKVACDNFVNAMKGNL